MKLRLEGTKCPSSPTTVYPSSPFLPPSLDGGAVADCLISPLSKAWQCFAVILASGSERNVLHNVLYECMVSEQPPSHPWTITTSSSGRTVNLRDLLPRLPSPIVAAGENACPEVRRVLHRKHPESKHPSSVCPCRPEVLRLVRDAQHCIGDSWNRCSSPPI